MQKQQQSPEPEKFERWTAQRTVAIILEVLKGQISLPEASRRYGFTQGEYRKWADEFMRGGVDALKVNRKGLDAEHRAEIRRLQAKIGQLVMDNEIAKEALRIIPLDESEQRSIDSLLGKASRESPSVESWACHAARRTTGHDRARRRLTRSWLSESSI
jgi:transposase-like protein